jgi:hypothetical protein
MLAARALGGNETRSVDLPAFPTMGNKIRPIKLCIPSDSLLAICILCLHSTRTPLAHDSRLGKVPLSSSLIDTGDQHVGADGRSDGDEGQPAKCRVGVHLWLFLFFDFAVLVGPSGLSVGFEQRGVGFELFDRIKAGQHCGTIKEQIEPLPRAPGSRGRTCRHRAR